MSKAGRRSNKITSDIIGLGKDIVTFRSQYYRSGERLRKIIWNFKLKYVHVDAFCQAEDSLCSSCSNLSWYVNTLVAMNDYLFRESFRILSFLFGANRMSGSGSNESVQSRNFPVVFPLSINLYCFYRTDRSPILFRLTCQSCCSINLNQSWKQTSYTPANRRELKIRLEMLHQA